MTALPSPEFTTPVQDLKTRRNRIRSQVPRSIHQRPSSSPTTRQRKLFAATSKLAIYSMLSVIGIASLANLVHYSWTQQNKLHQLRSEVKDAKQRLAVQNSEFQHSFDPSRGKVMMEENSYRIPVDQQPIILYSQPKGH
jgi:hypothetical protein